MKTPLLYEFGPEVLKNVHYIEILNPGNWQSRHDYHIGFLEKILPFEIIGAKNFLVVAFP